MQAKKKQKSSRHLQTAKNVETKLADNKETLYRSSAKFFSFFFLTSQANEGHPFSLGS